MIEIDFDGHLKCQIEIDEIGVIRVLKAVNGYGHPVNCNNVRITDSTDNTN